MELIDLLRSLRRHWIAALTAFALVLAAGFYMAYRPQPRYRAVASVLLEPNVSATNPFVGFQIVSFLVPSLETKVDSRTFATEAAKLVPPPFANAPVSVTASGDPETGLIQLVATSPNRRAVAPWANAFARHLVETGTSVEAVRLVPLDPALQPSAPYTPVRPPVIFGSGVLGLIAALFTGVGLDSVRRSRDNTDEIVRRFGTSVLGEIPLIRGRRRIGAAPVHLFAERGAPAAIEGIQALRTSVEVALLSIPAPVVMITSIASGEGKSVVTSHLGWALASVGHHVTVVDGDLRHPTQHIHLEVPFGPGLCDAASLPAATLALPTRLPTLRLVPAGVPHRHPAEVVREALPLLVDALASRDGVVLIDSPPLDGVAESIQIASITQHVILVIDARTDPREIERAINDLRELRAEILGIVVNRSRRRQRRANERYYVLPDRDRPRGARVHPVPRPEHRGPEPGTKPLTRPGREA